MPVAITGAALLGIGTQIATGWGGASPTPWLVIGALLLLGGIFVRA